MKAISATLALLLSLCSQMVVAADAPTLVGIDAEVWNGLSRTSWITQGDGARVVYAIVDANCSYSRELFKKVQGLANPDLVQVRWVPVGVLAGVAEDSRYKAAAAMKGGFKTFSFVMRGGAPVVKPSQAEYAPVDSNADFLFHEIIKYSSKGVPKFIYVKEAGNEVRLFSGVPGQAELVKALR